MTFSDGGNSHWLHGLNSLSYQLQIWSAQQLTPWRTQVLSSLLSPVCDLVFRLALLVIPKTSTILLGDTLGKRMLEEDTIPLCKNKCNLS